MGINPKKQNRVQCAANVFLKEEMYMDIGVAVMLHHIKDT